MLRREGWTMNRKLTYRLYREAGLAVRRRKRKRIGPFETPGFGFYDSGAQWHYSFA